MLRLDTFSHHDQLDCEQVTRVFVKTDDPSTLKNDMMSMEALAYESEQDLLPFVDVTPTIETETGRLYASVRPSTNGSFIESFCPSRDVLFPPVPTLKSEGRMLLRTRSMRGQFSGLGHGYQAWPDCPGFVVHHIVWKVDNEVTVDHVSIDGHQYPYSDDMAIMQRKRHKQQPHPTGQGWGCMYFGLFDGTGGCHVGKVQLVTRMMSNFRPRHNHSTIWLFGR